MQYNGPPHILCMQNSVCLLVNCRDAGRQIEIIFPKVYLQGRKSAAGRAMAPPQWPPHSKIQVGRGYSCLSLGSAGTLLWDKVMPGQSLLDSSGPKKE